MLIVIVNNNVCYLFINKEGFDLIKKVVINVNLICDKVLRMIIIGKLVSRNLSFVFKVINIVIGIDIKIFKNKGIWFVKVKEVGLIIILVGMIIGIMIVKVIKIEV